MSYATFCVFKDGNYWSKPYTYKSDSQYKMGDIVLVPMRDFYNVAKVIKSVPEDQHEFKPDIQYKSIIKKVL